MAPWSILGALLTGDGRVDSEISRRIGIAAGDLRRLQQLWNHARVSLNDKLRFFQSLVVSRLCYGLATACLIAAQARRLDGFYAPCLRKILKIPVAFISRVSNQEVLRRASAQPLTRQIKHRQFELLGRAARAPVHSLMRSSVFVGDGFVIRAACGQTTAGLGNGGPERRCAHVWAGRVSIHITV